MVLHKIQAKGLVFITTSKGFSRFCPATISSSRGSMRIKRSEELHNQLPPDSDIIRLRIKERAKNKEETRPNVMAVDLLVFMIL